MGSEMCIRDRVFALADALTERLPKEVTVAPSLADVDPYSYL